MSNEYNGKKRSELPDSVFGIPQERKYPMPDEKHTRSAIKLFNHVDPKYEEQLAKAVIKNMKKYGIDGSVVGPNNRLRKYLPKDMIKESANRPLIYTWERANIPEYSVIRESSMPEEIPNNIRELLRRLNSYDYGYIKNGKKIKGMKNFFEDYKSLTISEFEKYQIGVCWDYVHYEAYWFAKNHYKYETFYIQVQDEDNDCPSHTYLVFYLPNSSKVYYFESSWGKYQGIEAFDNINKLHNTIKERHIESARSKCDPKTYFRNKYDAKSSRWEHLSCGDYMVKVSNGKVKVNESYIEEGYFKSTDNLEFNLNKWSKSGPHNLLYITGISGSGKTTLAKEMCKKYKAEYIELDKFTLGIVKGLDRWFENVNNGTYEVHPLLKEYFSKLDHLTTNGSWSKPDMGDEHTKFLIWLINKVKGDGTLYIVEGAQFFMKLSNMDPDLIKGEPLIVVGTSAFKSWVRRIKRDTANDETISRFIYHLKKDVPMLFKYYFSNEKDLQKYIKNMQSNVNESYIEESSHNKVYHLSQTNLDGKTIQPTVPSNYMTKNGYEDGKTKRVCFATSIDGCLRGLSQKCEGMKLFVHIPDGNYNIYKPSNKEVPDASITGEVWIKKAVKMKCIGQIYVIGDKGEDGIPYKYGDKTAELYDWEWKWIDRFNESSSILPQDTGISTVIFDLGDVLVSANIKDYLMADPEVPNEIVDELLKLWFIDKDEVDDTMDLDTYREIVNKRMGVEFSKYIPKLFQYNVECVTAFDYTIPMIQDLQDKGYKVYYLSNWSAWTYDLLQEAGKFDFLELMDGGVFSYDAGYMKPNEEIYKILLNKYKINPEEAVFFDDREENIEAANKLGIHGVHFPRHDSSIVYNSLKVMQIAHEIFNISYSFKPCDMPEFITFSPKPALETVCMDIEIIPGASVTQDDDGSVKVKSYNKRYYDYDTVMQSFIEAAKREGFPISIKNGNDRFEYTPSTKEKPYGEVGGVSISKGGFTEETIQEELAKHSIAIENQHMVAKSSMKIIKPVILNNDGYRKRAKDLNLKLRCDLLPVKGPTINIRVLDRYQNCEDPSSAKQLLDDIKESCVTVASKLSGTFQYYVEEVTTDDNGCLNLHIKKMKVVSYNSDNEVMKEEDMEYPDLPVVLNIDSDITTVDIDKTLEESAVQESVKTRNQIGNKEIKDIKTIISSLEDDSFNDFKFRDIVYCDIRYKNKEPIAFITIRIKNVNNYTVGYVSLAVNPKYQNQGIGKSLATKAVSWFKKEKGIHFLEWHCLQNNEASKKLANDAGFREYIAKNKDEYIRYTMESSIQEYGTTGGTIVGANQPLYFYHMVDSGANLSKGLLSLEYMYHHSKSLFLKNASKYRDRLCNGWNIYPGRDPKSLTAEEIYEGIKKFRNEDNLNTIYFFRYPPYSSLDKRFDRLYKYKKLYRININDPKVKSIIKNINYGWIDSNRDNDPLDREYYETISPEDYFNNFDPDKGLLFSTLYHISIEVKNGYIPMRLLEEVKVPNTIEDIISMEESSIQEYGTTGGTIVGANQPDSVYIVNYMQNNVFSGYKEPKQAICKKGMNQMYTTKNGKAIPVDIDKFKEEASDISVFRFKETPILSFDKIIENASVDGDFYMLLTGDYPTNQHEIEYDNRFIQEDNFFDKLDDITYCTESTIIGQIEATDYPYMKILTESMEGRCWNYYRDINGVFAMNELTGLRTPSYEDITDIPNSQIQLIERGTVYFGD